MEKIGASPVSATVGPTSNATAALMNNKNNNEFVVNSPTPINLHGTMLACSGTTGVCDGSGNGETNIGVSCTSASDNASSVHNNYSSSSNSSTNDIVVAAGADNNIDVGVRPQLKSENNSVNEQTSLRSNFKKSNTCGSLFAKCACGNHYYANYYSPYNTIATTTPTSPPRSTITDFAFRDSSDNSYGGGSEPTVHRVETQQPPGGGRKVRRLLQSYSHPDATNIVFTDENKLPKCNNLASVAFVGDKNSSSSAASVTRSSSRDSYVCTKTGKKREILESFRFN